MTNMIKIKTKLGKFSLNVNFEISKGINCLFGPSGSGKTSVINCIAGLIKPLNSHISINQRLLNDTRNNYFCPIHKRKIGYVFQDARLFPHLSVKNNLLYGKKFNKQDKFGFNFIVDILDLTKLLKRFPVNLSGGEKQRIAIGRALLSQPDIILMDEPLVSLDQEKKENIIKYIKKIDMKLNIPMIYVSHSITETFVLGKKISFIKNGKIIFSGNKQKALNYYNQEYNFYNKNSFIRGKVIKLNRSTGLTEIDIGKNKLLIFSNSFTVGSKVIVKIRSSDIIISKRIPIEISSLNFLKVNIKNIIFQEKLILLLLKHEDEIIKAHITKKSFIDLNLNKFDTCYALIKAVNINDIYRVSFI